MAAAAIAVAVLMLTTWAIGTAIKDVSIVDIVWGIGFVVSAWASHLASDDTAGGAGKLVVLCVTLWGLRLAVHLARRNLGHGEDQRYQAMRAKRPDTYWIYSLPSVFLLQGVIMLVVGLPVTLSVGRDSGTVGVLAGLGLLIWAIGLFFETIGDLQLTRFKADPSNKGKVMDQGLWRYTRHPNYFGDFTVWWGLWLMGLDCGAPIWTVVGPITMTVFLLRVSGVAMLERTITKRRPDYEEYVRRTSAFIPRPPRP